MTVNAPRIYNLHPLLAGPIREWRQHLPRAAAMGFDWLYINAFWAPGGSGSIYAIADPYELHPLVRGDVAAAADRLVADVIAEAGRHGLRVMLDLVVPHAAADGRLVTERPDWFKRHDGGLVAPVLANPTDPRRPRHMGDLAELELRNPALQSAQLDYFVALASHYLQLGAAGFRCSSAYKVPAEFWRPLLSRLKAEHRQAVFLAAALGCPFPETLALRGCGFDLVFDSSRWWDFHDHWFLDQYDELRHLAPTVAFPEDHNTPRLAEAFDAVEPAEIDRLYRSRLLYAAAIGCGLLIPMGFEYGCRRRLDPIHSRPDDWQAETREPVVDLTGMITEVNALKAATPVLTVPGPIRRVSAPNARIVALMRLDKGSPLIADSVALTILNPDRARSDGVALGPLLTAAGGRVGDFVNVTPGVPACSFAPAEPLTLAAQAVRIFKGEAVTTALPVPDAAAAERRLRDLAQHRVAIERVAPELDGGRFPIKRIVGDLLTVEADIFCDGHDKLGAQVRYREIGKDEWATVPMALVDNDRWAGSFPLTRNTRYVFTVDAWRDLYASWRLEVGKKHDASQPIRVELNEGLALLERAAEAAGAREAEPKLAHALERARDRRDDDGFLLALLLGEETRALMERFGPRADRSSFGRELEVVADRTAGAFAAWYELFPRSTSDDPQRHGTFDDVVRRLPYVRDLGFDVLYFPPIHPIGRRNRKGRNNSLTAKPSDPGSPYAIGAEEGGHDALHKELGTLEDFQRLIAAAHEHGLEIAIDFAIQCAPDHPWIRQHPEWFDWRPDGTIKYAENPPKKYEDIVNVRFYGKSVPGLWYELRDVVLFWVNQGVKTFRVDNPHTKPLPFWEWMIREVQDQHPDTIFLSEAFTRPKMMKRLAKVGFTQSYSYFTWRNTKAELKEYLIELTQDEPAEHMRPNFFVNTPDINPVFLQKSGRAGFRIRAVLAATLSPLWGVYNGFELCEASALPGKEEYLDSEKYEIKAWDWQRPIHIRDDIRRLNRLRRENPALWKFTNLEFQEAWNDNVLVYSKITDSGDNAILVAVNLDPNQAQSCRFEVPLWRFGLGDDSTIGVEDLVSEQRFAWTGKVQNVWLDPAVNPYAVWRLVPPGLPA